MLKNKERKNIDKLDHHHKFFFGCQYEGKHMLSKPWRHNEVNNFIELSLFIDIKIVTE
jgi:hypothetical protein